MVDYSRILKSKITESWKVTRWMLGFLVVFVLFSFIGPVADVFNGKEFWYVVGVILAFNSLVWLDTGILKYRIVKGYYGNNYGEAREILEYYDNE